MSSLVLQLLPAFADVTITLPLTNNAHKARNQTKNSAIFQPKKKRQIFYKYFARGERQGKSESESHGLGLGIGLGVDQGARPECYAICVRVCVCVAHKFFSYL